MDATNQKLLQRVMLRINNHPISRIFSQPLTSDSTIDLSIISNRIAQNSYDSVNQFLNDIEKMCYSARLHFDKVQHYVASADLLKKLVYKEIQNLGANLNIHNWCNQTYKIRQKLKKLIDSPPNMPNKIFYTGIDPARIIEPQLPTEAMLKKLVDLSSRVLTQSDLPIIPQIINSHQPEISLSESMPIDVRRLSIPSINALMKFMEQKLKAKNVPNTDNVPMFTGI